MLQTLIASDSKTVTNATHVRGQVGSRALIVPTHTNHLSTTCLPHVRLETRLPDGTKFREGWSLGTRLHPSRIPLGYLSDTVVPFMLLYKRYNSMYLLYNSLFIAFCYSQGFPLELCLPSLESYNTRIIFSVCNCLTSSNFSSTHGFPCKNVKIVFWL